MKAEETLDFLIKALIDESGMSSLAVPKDIEGKKRLFRALTNVRPPLPVTKEFLEAQDLYLAALREEKGVARVKDITSSGKGVYLWRGDITTLDADAIVNAANEKLLGCFVPCHGCVDNAIHSAAGVQLRLACAEIMAGKQGDEERGRAEVTPAFNLPSKYVIHTVGPIVTGRVTDRDRKLLAMCYDSCMKAAEGRKLKNIAFCCISTGEYNFPSEEAAEIAVNTVMSFRQNNKNAPEVIFDVYSQTDYDAYAGLLG